MLCGGQDPAGPALSLMGWFLSVSEGKDVSLTAQVTLSHIMETGGCSEEKRTRSGTRGAAELIVQSESHGINCMISVDRS